MLTSGWLDLVSQEVAVVLLSKYLPGADVRLAGLGVPGGGCCAHVHALRAVRQEGIAARATTQAVVQHTQ